MQDYIYSVIAFLAMVIHLIINSDMFPGRKVSNMHSAREYRVFPVGVFGYYLTDAAWGAPDSNSADTGTLRCAVSDTGIGISEEDQKKLMEPFVQLSNIRAAESFSGSRLSKRGHIPVPRLCRIILKEKRKHA